MTIRRAFAIALITAATALPAAAQQKAGPPAPLATMVPPAPEGGPAVPLKVTVVLSRYQGDKRISSMPYVMGVTAKDFRNAPKTTLRMGVDVPVIQTVFGAPADGKSVPQSSYSYRNVGTNIDCTAAPDPATPGVFQLVMTVSDTSVSLGSGPRQGSSPVAPDVPNFRSFNSSFTALLRDGQTTQYTSATDPLSGEVMKIDVTLNLMK